MTAKGRSVNQSDVHPRDALWVTLLAAVVHLPGIFWGIPFGKALVGGMHVLGGDVPYRDFWTMYAPGQFYAMAGVFGLFGRELLVQATLAVILTASAIGFFFSLCRRAGIPRPTSWVLAGMAILFLWRTSPELSHWPLALALYMAGLDRVAAYFQQGGPGRLLMAGVLFGLTAACKHDVGGYMALASMLAVTLAWFAAGKRRPPYWQHPLKAVLLIGLGSACIVLPVIVALWISAGPDAWHDLIVFPSGEFRSVRAEGYAGLVPALGPVRAWLAEPARLELARDAFTSQARWIYLLFPQFAMPLGLGSLVWLRRRMPPVALAHALLVLCCLPFFWAAAHVQANTHIFSMALMTLILGGLAWSALAGGSSRWPRPVLAVACAIYFAALCTPAGMQLSLVVMHWKESRVLSLPGAHGVRVSAAEHALYTAVTEFVQRRTRPDEPIYVAVRRHDAIVIGNQRFYFLTRRPSATRYDELHPAVVDRLPVQQEMIRDIEKAGVRCVVLWNFGWSDRRLNQILARRRKNLPDVGADLLDRYIAEHYEPVARYGEYEILWRRDGGVSPQDSRGR